MSNDTVAQELADCWYGRGIYQPGNAEKSMAKFLSRNIVIPRSELPEVKGDSRYGTVGIDGELFSIDGVWKNPLRWHEKAINILAIAAYLESDAAKEAEKIAARDKRRDEVAAELWPFAGAYGPLSSNAQSAIDRIIELEASK